jgi:hypothetical protein
MGCEHGRRLTCIIEAHNPNDHRPFGGEEWQAVVAERGVWKWPLTSAIPSVKRQRFER